MTPFRLVLEVLRSSLWFVPALMLLGAIMLAAVLIEIDSGLDVKQLSPYWQRILSAGVDGARSMLVAIASSMATVAGVTFSITIVVLALASSQYSSRVLRNFMRDRANQTVLGVFIGLFAYCLIVLRAINAGQTEFVPALAVLAALVLTLIAIGFFIFFIHHVSASIQAANITANIAEETLATIGRLFPDPANKERDLPELSVDSELEWSPLPAPKTGYIQGIDTEAVHKLARKHGITLRMEFSIGDFVTEGATLGYVTGPSVNQKLRHALAAAYSIGRQRTLQQDVGFGIRQLVDVALKALSPGINDTTTAINCIDYLGAILEKLATRCITSALDSGNGALIPPVGATFESLLAEALDQIRHNGEGNAAVLLRMLQSLHLVAACTREPLRQQALRHHARLIVETAERTLACAADRLPIASMEKRILARLAA